MTDHNINFHLHDFFPYQTRVFYHDVSDAVARIYSNEYKLNKSEWRTMVILWPNKLLSAKEIVDVSSMDKVSVSRAVARMTKRGLLHQCKDDNDGRIVLLSLSEQGKQDCGDLIKKVQKVEAQLLEGVTKKELQQLRALMQKIRNNVHQ